MTHYRRTTERQAVKALEEYLSERADALTRLREYLVSDGPDPDAAEQVCHHRVKRDRRRNRPVLNSPLSGSERDPPLMVAVEADLMRHRGGPLREDREVVLVTAPDRDAEQLEKWVTDRRKARVPEPD